jgi:aspartate-semialdehyde dehydrogenase
MTQKSYNIAVVGATGMVGTSLLTLLAERKFPVKNIFLLASANSAGEVLEFAGQSKMVLDLADFDFSQTEISFFCAGNEISASYASKATAAGNVVIDKSSYFRNDPQVPLIVPEVNLQALGQYKNKNIIANPNCSTIPLVMVLKPIYDAVGLARVNIATYQSVSGSGKEGINELAQQTALLLNGKKIKPKVYSQQIAFNIIPQIDELQENGYTLEEMKVIWETQKILADTTVAVNPTAVRVPVFFGHAAAVHLETKEKITASEATKLLANMPGVKISKGKNNYSTPVRDAAGKDEVYVGRIREDLSHEFGLDLWVVTDNIRKGAALNAVQIAEALIANYL